MSARPGPMIPSVPAPTPPELPAEVPADLRDFIECRAGTVTIGEGPQAWVRLPRQVAAFLSGGTKPQLKIVPGPTAGTARIEVRLGFIGVSLPAST